MISIIEDSKNIKEIFCTICTEISKYKKELFSNNRFEKELRCYAPF